MGLAKQFIRLALPPFRPPCRSPVPPPLFALQPHLPQIDLGRTRAPLRISPHFLRISPHFCCLRPFHGPPTLFHGFPERLAIRPVSSSYLHALPSLFFVEHFRRRRPKLSPPIPSENKLSARRRRIMVSWEASSFPGYGTPPPIPPRYVLGFAQTMCLFLNLAIGLDFSCILLSFRIKNRVVAMSGV